MSGQLSTLSPQPSASDKEMGEQLTAQYDRATGGMREVLKFGCMMMMLRAHIVSTLDTAPKSGALPRGVTSKDGGIKKWIETHAPKVQRATAYRFEDVARAVQQAYQLPAKIAKRLTFEQIVTSENGDLDADARTVRLKVFSFVDGTSQKSWLDDIKAQRERGGDTSGSRRKLTPEQARKEFLENAEKNFTNTILSLDQLADEKKEIWKAPSISDAMLSDSADLMAELARRIRAWLKTPRVQRTKINLEEIGL